MAWRSKKCPKSLFSITNRGAAMQRFCANTMLSISIRPCVVSTMPRVKEADDSSEEGSLSGDEEEPSELLDEGDARGAADDATGHDEETVAVKGATSLNDRPMAPANGQSGAD